MTEQNIKQKRTAGWTIFFVLALYAAWAGAWFLERFLEKSAGLPAAGFVHTAYWLIMKLLLWVVPALGIIRLSYQSHRRCFLRAAACYRFALGRRHRPCFGTHICFRTLNFKYAFIYGSMGMGASQRGCHIAGGGRDYLAGSGA